MSLDGTIIGVDLDGVGSDVDDNLANLERLRAPRAESSGELYRLVHEHAQTV